MSTPAEPARRLFFALWPHAEARAALVHEVAHAVRHCGGRPVPVRNLHVTLVFLGSVATARVPALESLARHCAGETSVPRPLPLRWIRLEHWERSQVLCAVPEDGAAVTALAAALQAAATAEGFSPDLKPFRAHVTLARKVMRPPPLPALHPVDWSFDGFALVESRTESEGAVYSIVASYPLVAAH